MTTTPIDAIFIAVKKPFEYDFKGKKGTAYSGTFLVGDKPLVAKLTEEVYNEVKELKNQDGKVVFELFISETGIVQPKPKATSFTWS